MKNVLAAVASLLVIAALGSPLYAQDADPAPEAPAGEMPADEPAPADGDPDAEAPSSDAPAGEEPPAADDPSGDPPAGEEPPADDEPPAGDEPPADEPPAEGEGEMTPEAEGETPPTDAPPTDQPPTDAPPADTTTDPADTDQADASSEVSVDSYYPAEEAEFGPIDPDYRGPVELSPYMGYSFFDNDKFGIEDSGGFFGGARVTFNFGNESNIGFDVTWGTTRLDFEHKDTNERFNNQVGTRTLNSEVTIHNFTLGLTYRMNYLRTEYLTPFVRFEVGVNYFDDLKTKATFIPNGATSGQLVNAKLESAFGASVQLAMGFDYKLSRNWSLRLESGGGYWFTDWREGENGGFIFNALQFGVVWHFQ